MKTETETIAGETKTVRALKPFRHMGNMIPEGATVEVDSETTKYLMGHRLGHMEHGGCFDIARCSDGFHRLTPWDPHFNSYAGEDWWRVEFLRDFAALQVKAGDKRRLKVSHAREFTHKFSDSPPPPPNCTVANPYPVAILIHEERPKRMSDEEFNQRVHDVSADMARENSWMAGTVRV